MYTKYKYISYGEISVCRLYWYFLDNRDAKKAVPVYDADSVQAFRIVYWNKSDLYKAMYGKQIKTRTNRL